MASTDARAVFALTEVAFWPVATMKQRSPDSRPTGMGWLTMKPDGGHVRMLPYGCKANVSLCYKALNNWYIPERGWSTGILLQILERSQPGAGECGPSTSGSLAVPCRGQMAGQSRLAMRAVQHHHAIFL